MSVVGVDACKRGWIAIVVRPSSTPRGVFAETLEQLLGDIPDARAVAIDIPIGPPVDGRRRADVEARAFVGSRRSSVFFTPVREALTAPSHADASSTSRALTGRGLSQQAYALGPKILEAERWVSQTSLPTWEVHPEVSFTVMLGRPARWPKTTWTGARERMEALTREGMALDDVGGAGAYAAVDDVLDAAAAAWSALRLSRGEGLCFPDPPDLDPRSGRKVAIWV